MFRTFDQLKKYISRYTVGTLFLLILLFSVILCPAMTKAETESGENLKLRDSGSSDFLVITMEKNGSTITSTSDSTTIPVVNVLEQTEWQLKAQYIVTNENGKKSVKDVTSQCTWGTPKDRYNIKVSEGKITAYFSDDKETMVAAAYTTYVNIDGQTMPKTYSAKIKFNVKQLSIRSSDTEQMRCLAFTQLLMTKENELFNEQYTGTKVSSFIETLYPKTHNVYLLQNGEKNSATMLNFYSSTVGESVFLTYFSSETPLRAAVFRNGNTVYLSYYYKANRMEDFSYEPLFQEAYAYYKMAASSKYRVVVTGEGLGGTAAKYISYITGCPSVTFNAKSPLAYVTLHNFEEFCKYYSYNDQLSYVNPGMTGSYLTEPYYTISPRSVNNSVGLNKMVSYSQQSETVYFGSSSKHVERNQEVWGRDFYLGANSSNKYSVSAYSEKILVGGDQNDTLKLYGDDQRVPALSCILQAELVSMQIFSTMMPGASGTALSMAAGQVSDVIDAKGPGEMVFNRVTDVIGSCGVPGFLITFPKVMYDGAMSLADGIYPYNNMVIGGKGNDVMHGTVSTDWYIYTKGDGHDTIYDGYGVLMDVIYLMDCDPSEFNYIYDEENPHLVHFTIGGEPAIDFYMDNSGVDVVFGSPFHNNRQAYPFVVNTGRKIEACIEVACPVNVEVYDSSNNHILTLKDGVEQAVTNDYGMFEVQKRGDEYVKALILYDPDCNVVITGTGTGDMDYFASYFDDEGNRSQQGTVRGVSVAKGEKFYPSKDMKNTILFVDRDGDGEIDGSIDRNTSINILEDEITLPYGASAQLQIDFQTNSAWNGYVWVSENNDIVSVDENGVVTANGFGTAKIMAATLDGERYDTCTVTVEEAFLSAEDFTVSGLEETYEYTGYALDIIFDVFYNETLLTEGKDYTVVFSELTEPGEAYVYIDGIGAYAGRKRIGYSIVLPKEIQDVAEQVSKVANDCRKKGYTSEYEKAVFLHDWLVNHANYDYTYTYYYEDGVLIHKTGVCNSYALAYSLLLDEVGIENEFLAAPEMDHAWNLAKLDGQWCHIDCTWDDPGIGGAENHSYFGMNDDLIARDHTWDRDKYRSCSSLQNYYYQREGYAVFETVEELQAILENKLESAFKTIKLSYIGTDTKFNVIRSAFDYLKKNDWKYGIYSYGSSGDQYNIDLSIEYGEPWEQPGEFTGIAAFPNYKNMILRGPNGTYKLSDYSENGIILIFGRDGCFNTKSLLENINDKLTDLRASGVEVFINNVDASVPEDFGELNQLYPNFIYTYGNSDLMYSMEEAIGVEFYTFPFVFFVNKNGMITYASEDYIDDVEAFIDTALELETDHPLPGAGPVDPNYEGNYFVYRNKTSNAALKKAIKEQLDSEMPVIFIKDASDDGATGNIWPLLDKMFTLAETLKEGPCDFEVDKSMYYMNPYIQAVGIGVTYNVHTYVDDPAVDPTCTKEGKTAGRHCSTCGEVAEEQEMISALGHNMTKIDGFEPTCTEDGEEDQYYCEDCKKYFRDSAGQEQIRNKVILPAGHLYNSWISNYDGTHLAVCDRDNSHTAEEPCSYSYTALETNYEAQQEKGRYTCQKCGYSLMVVRTIMNRDQISLTESKLHCTGTELKPGVTINGLTENVDYKLSYENNTEPGTGLVRVTGIGNFTGVFELEFEIEPHTPGETVRENEIEATSQKEGSYEEAVYCTICNRKISSEIKTIPKKPALARAKVATLVNTANGIKITWNKIADAAGYYIYRKVGSGSFTRIATIKNGTTVTYEDKSSLASGTTYTYAARAYRGSETGPYTALSVMRLANTKVSALANTASGIKITWNKVAGASGYYIYRKTGSGSYAKIATIKSGTTVTYEDKSSLTNGTTYGYAVKAFNGSVQGTYTGLSAIRLGRPTISGCSNTASRAVTVKWNRNTKATGYQVMYKLGSTSRNVTINKNATVSYVIKSLTKGKTYNVYVRSYRTSGGKNYYSAWSAAKSVKITR